MRGSYVLQNCVRRSVQDKTDILTPGREVLRRESDQCRQEDHPARPESDGDSEKAAKVDEISCRWLNQCCQWMIGCASITDMMLFYCFELWATRKPRLVPALVGTFLLRFADRQFRASLFQLPPRFTRFVP